MKALHVAGDRAVPVNRTALEPPAWHRAASLLRSNGRKRMPSKSHRAASRQAQLRRRKRRGKARPQEFDAGPTESRGAAQAAALDGEPQPGAEAALEPVGALTGHEPTSRSARRPRQKAAAQRASAYDYMGAELKRIGLLTTFVVVILAVLAFVLSS